MRERAALFALDVVRLRPLVALVLAVVVNLPSVLEVLQGNLAVTTALWRLALALALALVVTHLIARLLLRYSAEVAIASEDEPVESPPGR